MYRLWVQNTSFARKATFAYVYNLWALSSLCIWIHILCTSKLLRMYTTCALKETYAYEYGFARKSTYCVRVQLFAKSDLCIRGTALRVNWLILQGIYWLLDVAMTVVQMLDARMTLWWTSMDARWFCDHTDSFPWRICLKGAIFWSLLYDDLAFRLGRPSHLGLRVLLRYSLDVPCVWASDF